MYGISTGQEMTADKVLADNGIGNDEPDQAIDRALSSLGAHVQRCWHSARMAKEKHHQEMLRCLRQREGIYDPETLAVIQEQGGSEIFMMLSQVKGRATESWLMDMMFPAGDERPYSVDPTSVSDLQPQIHAEVEARVMQEVQMAVMLGIEVDPAKIQDRIRNIETQILDLIQRIAKEKAEAMERRINDVVDEGDWQEALEDFIADFVTYPTAFLEGPCRIRKKRLHWSQDEFGQTHPAATVESVRKFKCISGFDVYPSGSSRSLDDGDLIIIKRWRRKELYNLIGLPGWDADAIREVITKYGDSGHKVHTASQTERDQLEGRHREDVATGVLIEGINFWGQVRGQWLIDHGLPEAMVPDPYDDYEANVVMIGDLIIRAALNPHPLGRRPYYAASLEKVNGQIWGKGIMQIIRDLQQICNAAARSLVNNMAFASGPMADVQVDRLAEGEQVGGWYPWRTIQTTESKHSASSRSAVQFFQPNSNANELMQVFSFFSQLADEYSGIPPYATGQNMRSGAASTASGMAMLQDNAARGIKRGIKAIDRVVSASIEATFEDVMLYDDAEDAKGDIRIVAKASTALANRERQAIRRNELIVATNNPVDMSIMGLEGRLKLLEDLFQTYDIDPTDILPTRDEMRARLMAQAGMPPAPSQGQPSMGPEQNGAGMDQGGQQPNERALPVRPSEPMAMTG